MTKHALASLLPETDRLASLRAAIREANLADEAEAVARLAGEADLDAGARQAISARARGFVEKVRAASSSGMLESFLAEYTLSTTEGIALMCLAEALLRVPDTRTIDDLIEDKIAPSRWAEHLDRANSPLVNVSTLALTLTGEVLRDSGAGIAGTLKSLVQRIGEPVIRAAVLQAMKILGGQFVLGRTIEEATKLARKQEKEGFSYSYDMLGEAARTEADAKRYRTAYAEAIAVLATRCKSAEVRDNPGVSVKLSALHPRYEVMKRDRVMEELVERTLALALMARGANMGFNIDAEEADRLDLSLDVIAAVLADPRLAGWDGFGVVVQAYGQRASYVIDWVEELAASLDRRVMVRLVKGAYWDAEIKRAQVMGLAGFPVFTRKAATDISFIANARRLLSKRERIYPQFATHNAHTVAAVLHLAQDLGATTAEYEFQRLHGMGERLHAILMDEAGTRTRIYAPVGRHADLLAYLVRRLLENGANGSFVNMIADRDVPAEVVVRDPFAAVAGEAVRVTAPADIFQPQRGNSRGWDLTDPTTLEALEAQRGGFATHRWASGPMLAGEVDGDATHEVVSPATGEIVGAVVTASRKDIDTALDAARAAAPGWAARPVRERADLLRRTADLYEAHAPELFALAAREAGKTLPDCVSEVREAADFLRYYAAEAERAEPRAARGVFTCISPWNFPLAIFTGQIAAALVAGNAVVAKPAEATPLIAARAVALMHEAGIPPEVVQLLPGAGSVVGTALTSDPRIDGVCFTGSLATAKVIDRAMADHLTPTAPLVAETGGLNAMIVDSTALPEQAVRDILASAFQSAGQRCSALRMLYLQEETAERTLEMLFGAMDELEAGDPWRLATDIGPVIDARARDKIEAHVAEFAARDAVLKRIDVPETGTFVAPTVLKVSGIADLKEEIFGPVLHVATFKADELDQVVAAINASGYGLTFGLHTRIDARMEQLAAAVRAGNIYINRNQIGAVVGSQPFGGEGLSGTGPKAGGPHYLPRFSRPLAEHSPSSAVNGLSGLSIGFAIAAADQVRAALDKAAPAPQAIAMPGPTGESNTLNVYPRGVVLCLGPDEASARAQAELALARRNAALVVAPGAQRIAAELGGDGAVIGGVDKRLAPAAIEAGLAVDAVLHWGEDAALKPWRQALANREGAIVPLVANPGDADRLILERHVCIDTTASGGNAELLAGGAPAGT
ncbi:bifunctional proline dehydrogenase/L-glutamate gamma-semialdehyde dehydrogenase PutA [Devosia sp.]|uniref:bifunctional proline dehydrogenase/L-glutamate gamma-semialdehyde dehydrogenase PutA n=1 Tax=Devosia sp. TaxID=1871048 RepID=UPI002EF1F593